jgi:hypothetical protein
MSAAQRTLGEAPLVVVYSLQASDGWEDARRHGRIWGRLYTSIHQLDEDHIALMFRPADDERWRDWEAERKRWILEEILEELAA